MNKKSSGNKVTFKKQIVRNPVKTNTKAVVTRDTVGVEPLDLKDVGSSGKSTFRDSFMPEIEASLENLSLGSKSRYQSIANTAEKDTKMSALSGKTINLSMPGVNSSLSLNKKVNTLGKIRPSSAKCKKAFDERVTRQVNFPYEKKIYKDLMPLSSPNKLVQKVLPSREPMPPKDKEPVLEDFIEQRSIREYSYVPNFKLENKKNRAHCNNLRLYKVLQLLEKC